MDGKTDGRDSHKIYWYGWFIRVLICHILKNTLVDCFLVLIPISILGILGNLSIIVIIARNKLLRLQPNNLFLFNMAIADFLMLLSIPTFYFFKQGVVFRFYYLGWTPCYLTPYLIGKRMYWLIMNWITQGLPNQIMTYHKYVAQHGFSCHCNICRFSLHSN